MPKGETLLETLTKKAKMKAHKSQWYNLRPILGMAN